VIVGVVSVYGASETPQSDQVRQAIATVAAVNLDQCQVSLSSETGSSATASYRVQVQEDSVAAVQTRLLAQVQSGTLLQTLQVRLLRHIAAIST
jgi:hypothetical protein